MRERTVLFVKTPPFSEDEFQTFQQLTNATNSELGVLSFFPLNTNFD